MRSPVAASQSRAVFSMLHPVRIVLPSGLNAADLTESGCARGWPMGWPVAASHSRAVLSPPPVRMVLPSGLKATDLTSSPWEKTRFGSTSWRRQADRLARATCLPASSPASAAIRSDSTVQSIPTPTCPFSKAAWPRSRSSIASRRFDSDRAI